MIGGTPLEPIELQVKRGGTIKIGSRDQLDKVYNEIIKQTGEEAVIDLAKQFRKNIILQLKMMPATKVTASYERNYLDRGGMSLREGVIESITPVKFTHYGGKFKASFEIDHDMAVALNDGTGIYGPEHQPIVAKNRKYMFIPGEEFYNQRMAFKAPPKYKQQVVEMRKEAMAQAKGMKRA